MLHCCAAWAPAAAAPRSVWRTGTRPTPARARQIAVLHRHPFIAPSAVVNAPFIQSPTLLAAAAFGDPPRGIPGARGSRSGGGGAGSGERAACAPAVGRLFDASGQRRAFFDPSLRQGY